MTERERLIKLFQEWEENKDKYDDVFDYLLLNGVIVPPCKIGDTVYHLVGDNLGNGFITLKPTHTEKYKYGFDLSMLGRYTHELKSCWFLTREEAEKALDEQVRKRKEL